MPSSNIKGSYVVSVSRVFNNWQFVWLSFHMWRCIVRRHDIDICSCSCGHGLEWRLQEEEAADASKNHVIIQRTSTWHHRAEVRGTDTSYLLGSHLLRLWCSLMALGTCSLALLWTETTADSAVALRRWSSGSETTCCSCFATHPHPCCLRHHYQYWIGTKPLQTTAFTESAPVQFCPGRSLALHVKSQNINFCLYDMRRQITVM